MLTYKPALTSDGCATVGEALSRWSNAPCLHRELVELHGICDGDAVVGGDNRATEGELQDVARSVWRRSEELSASYHRREPMALEVASLWTTSARADALPVPVNPRLGVELGVIDEVLVEMRARLI